MSGPKKKYVIAGNWKMNGQLTEGQNLIRKIEAYHIDNQVKSEVVVFPPFTMLRDISSEIKHSSLKMGAQDCSEHPKGAYTGDISASMLKDSGCNYVIVGHSERRSHHRETSEIVRKKAEQAHLQGLNTIICVGESLEEREAGKEFEIVAEQIISSLPTSATVDNTMIAYEPVWAIGTGKIAEKPQIAEMHSFINELIDDNFPKIRTEMKILYGGSVKSSNVVQILDINHVAGVLVGGASLDAAEFCKIIEIADKKW